MLEDGIGLQALTSPRLYDAAEWGMRVGGVNLAYWEATAIYHTVFSVAIPIALTELSFSSHGRRPYLRTGGLVLTATVTALGVAVLRFTVPVAQDPGYQAPLPFVLAVVVAVLVLGVVALRLLPRTGGRPTTRPVARPAWWYLGSFVAVLAFLALSHPMFGAEQPAFTRGDTVAIPMAAVVLLTVGAVLMLRSAGSSTGWTPRHTLAVAGGALVGHGVAGLAITAFVERTLADRVGLAVLTVLTAVVFVLLDRRLAATTTTPAD